MGILSSKPLGIPTKWFPEFEEKLPSLEGKTICITGCTSGTGYIVARTAIRKGAKDILLLNRESGRSAKAEELLKEVLSRSSGSKTECNIVTIPCDLQDFESVKAAVSTIKSKYEVIDVLCNNAGVMAMEDKATKDGYDVQMQTNHLSHFLLTKELFPLLKKAAEINGEARVCNHSSDLRQGKALEAEYFGKNGGNLGGNSSSMIFKGSRYVRYQQTKLANSVFTHALGDRFETIPGLKSAVAHPGLAQTSLQISTAQDGGMGSGTWFMFMAQSAEDGAMPIVAACFDPKTENKSFWMPSGMMTGPAKLKPFDKASMDANSKKLLWETSEEACGEFAF